MKYLNYRHEFLYEKKNFNKDLESSVLIREYIENVTRFGDTMIGRLFNSTWQLGRWAVKSFQIRNLLRELDDNLQNLIDRIDMTQVTKEFPLLTLKLQLERLKTVCTSTMTEPQKLDQLIGWDGQTIMFDSANPKADIPGIYDAQTRRLLLIPVPLAQEVYDNINEPTMRERLEGLKGPQVVKAFLDGISNFMDELRQLTLPAGAAKPDFSTNIFTFNQELQEILARVVRDVKELSNESKTSRIMGYATFINEDVIPSDQNVNSLEMVAKKIQNQIKQNPKSDITKTKEYQQLFDILSKLNDEQKGKIESDIQDLEKLTGETVEKPQGQSQKEPQKVEKPQAASPQVEKPQAASPQVEKPQAAPQVEKPQAAPQVEKPQAAAPQVEKPQAAAPQVEKPQAAPQVEKPQASAPQVEKPQAAAPQVEKTQAAAPQKKDEVQVKDEETTETEVAEGRYYNYINLVLEEAPKLFPDVKTASFGPGGTQQNPTTVKEIWDYLFQEIDRVVPAEMTQEEVERLTSYTPPRVDTAYDFVRNPDPLIRIVRIFDKANSIFTQALIPSGRMNGEVDNEVYRRFIYVGTSTPGTRERPGYGPWVQKYQWRQWTNGVYEMLANERFRDIFKDIQNIIPESKEFILEAEETKQGETKKTPYEIIKEFILDMLNVKNQGDFSKFESIAMKKYFGINVKPDQLVADKPGNLVSQPNTNGQSTPDTMVWMAWPGTSFTTAEMRQYFAFPISTITRGQVSNRIIFIEPIELVNNNVVQVKFTFDHQSVIEAERTNQTKYQQTPTVVNNWSCERITNESRNNVYYGLMVNDFRNNIRICWVNCSRSNTNQALPQIEHATANIITPTNFQTNTSRVPAVQSRLRYYNSTNQATEVQIARSSKVGTELDTTDLDNWQNALTELTDEGRNRQFWT
jgi:hypothetical protein